MATITVPVGAFRGDTWTPLSQISQFTWTSADNNHAVGTHGSYTIELVGSSNDIAVSGGDLTAGSIDSWTYKKSGVTQFALTSLSAVDLFDAGITSNTTLQQALFAGDDTFTGTVNIKNVIYGYGGNDSFTGFSNRDVFFGGNGDDSLLGMAGNDLLKGDAGNDTLDGGTGSDQMVGGTGDDLFIVDSTGDTVNEASGGGTDTVQSSISYTLSTYLENLTLTGASNLRGTGNSLDNIITANTGNDSLVGNAGDDTFSFASADLTVDDTISGGSGTDVVSISDAATVIDADFTHATSVEELAEGLTNGALTATLGALADAAGLTSVTGNGTGADAITVGAAFENDLTIDLGTGGNDSIDASAYTGDLTVQSVASGIDANDTITAGSGDDALELTADNGTATLGANVTGIETITVEEGESTTDDITIVTNDANVGAGDTLTVDASALTDSDATLTFTGSAETDGNFDVTGGAGDDVITGGAGDDTIDSGGGNDNLTGGAGDDMFAFLNADFTSGDSITGGADDDTIAISDAATVVDADFTNVATTEVLEQVTAATALTVTLGALANASGLATIIGNTGVDTVTVGAGFTNALEVDISTGADSVDASASTSALTIVADAAAITAADTLVGGSNDDGVILLTADNDATGAVFGASVSGFDTITVVEGDPVTNDIKITINDANIGSGDTLTVDASALTDSGATLTFDGSAETDGDFSVIGGAGDDTILGGDGDDRFYFTSDHFDSSDSITGDDGSDVIYITDAATVIDADFTNVTGVEGLGQATAATAFTATLDELAMDAGLTAVGGNTGNDSITIGAGFTNDLDVIINTGTDTVDGSASTADLTVIASAASITAADELHGGSDDGDVIELTADNDGTGAVFGANVDGFETISVVEGNTPTDDIIITTNDANVAADDTLTVDASALTDSGATLTFDGTAETDGNFSVTGGAGDDSFSGGAGDDTFDGGAGSGDTADYSDAGTAGVIVNLTNPFSTNAFGSDIGFDTLLNVEHIIGTDFADILTGGISASTLEGGQGDDQINGSSSADSLDGGAGLDIIDGKQGADDINGGTGADTMTGGASSDTFIFAAGDSGTPSATNFDVITDYAGDTIDYSASLVATDTSGGGTAPGNAAVDADGVATFDAADDTLAEQIVAVEADLGGDTAGEYAFWEFNGSTYMFISDAVAGVGVDDVLIKLSGVTGLTTANLAGGDLVIS
ncbi:MAG: calcium-binding protein [Rhodospirillales bacterium]|nr:calcium-binding protein [Rhodospirillales bacterium]